MNPELKRFHVVAFKKQGVQEEVRGADSMDDAISIGKAKMQSGSVVVIRDTKARPEREYGIDVEGNLQEMD